MHLQAFGLPLPRSCVVRGRPGRRYKVQRRHRHQRYQCWARSKEGAAQASAAAGILYL